MPLIGEGWRKPAQNRRGLYCGALALALGLALVVFWGWRPAEVWFGGTGVFIGGRYMPPGQPWYAVAAGPFASTAAMRIRSYSGRERGLYVSMGDFYYVLSLYDGRRATPVPGEQVYSHIYPISSDPR